MANHGPANALLPHRYPFVFVDRVDGDTVWLGVSGSGRPHGPGSDPTASVPASLALEILAQASLVLLASRTGDGEGEAREGMLAGIDEARFEPVLAVRPLVAGDRLAARCVVRARFGRLLKVGATLERDGEPVAQAELVLAGGG